jgi:phasin
MAKQPSESTGSGASSSGGKSDPAQGVRQAAESTLAQAKQAVDQYIQEASRLYGAMESSMEAAQSGTREINRKAIGFAEKNVNAAFDFAQQLVCAKDPKEIVQLQQEFLKRQVEQMSGQMKELNHAYFEKRSFSSSGSRLSLTQRRSATTKGSRFRRASKSATRRVKSSALAWQ